MIEDFSQLEPTPRLSLRSLLRYRLEPYWWALQHWLALRLGLQFCPSCGGYFYEHGMTLPDKCEHCYARDYGIDREPYA